MNLSQLYYFRKLAEVQHYTKAAQELYITQPSLSFHPVPGKGSGHRPVPAGRTGGKADQIRT